VERRRSANECAFNGFRYVKGREEERRGRVGAQLLGSKGRRRGRAAWGRLEGGNTPGRLEEEDDPGFPELGCKAVWANWSSGPARMRKQEQVGVPREI
jgi:hypothetical protein